MVVTRKSKDKDWEKLVNSLKKGIEEMKKDKKERLTAVEVICSQEDIDRTRQGWKNKKR